MEYAFAPELRIKRLKGTNNSRIIFRRYDATQKDIAHIETLWKEGDFKEPFDLDIYKKFLEFWPDLTFLAFEKSSNTCVGVVVGGIRFTDELTLEEESTPADIVDEWEEIETPTGTKELERVGNIALLVVKKDERRIGIGNHLVSLALRVFDHPYACSSVYVDVKTEFKALFHKLDFVTEGVFSADQYLNYFRIRAILQLPRSTENCDLVTDKDKESLADSKN